MRQMITAVATRLLSTMSRRCQRTGRNENRAVTVASVVLLMTAHSTAQCELHSQIRNPKIPITATQQCAGTFVSPGATSQTRLNWLVEPKLQITCLSKDRYSTSCMPNIIELGRGEEVGVCRWHPRK